MRSWFCFSLVEFYTRLKFESFEEAVKELTSTFTNDVHYYKTEEGDYRLTADCIHAWATLIDERAYSQENYDNN